MQLKKIILVLAQLGLVSAIGVTVAKQTDEPIKKIDQISSVSEESCTQETFWTTWFDNSNQFRGFGVPPSQKEISKAQYRFAENYHNGKVLTKDYQRALDLFTRAADSGLTQANFKLGLINHYGQGKAKDLSEAYTYYEKAALHNSPEALFDYFYVIDYFHVKNHEWFSKSAKDQTTLDINQCQIKAAGVTEAQFNLAQMHHYGIGTIKDMTLAAKWYEKSAANNMKEAQFNLAKLLLSGEGITYDFDRAMENYKLAAEQGLAEAQLNLAQMYHYGPSHIQDHFEAFAWYKKSAKQGMHEAEFNLGLMAHYGRGTNQDMFKL